MKNDDLKRFYPTNPRGGQDFVRYDDNGNIKVGKASNDSDAMSKKDVQDAINTAQLFVYKPGGSRAFADLGTPSKDRLGYVYNIIDDFTTNNYFIEGAGINYPSGTDVAVIEEDGDYWFATYVGRFDYNILDNVPIINTDLDDERIILTQNMYYRHMTEDPEHSSYKDGYIYLYDATGFHIIDTKWIRTINEVAPNSSGDITIEYISTINNEFPDNTRNITLNYISTINSQSPDANRNIDLNYVKTINSTSPDSNGNIDLNYVKTVDGNSPDSNGNVNSTGVKTIDGNSPDNTGNINLSYVKTVNSTSPDANGNVSLTYVKTINSVSPDANGDVAINYVATVNNVGPDNSRNVVINAVPNVPNDYASKTYQLETLSNGTYTWAEKAHLYQHYLDITTSSDSGTHIYTQFVAASAIPATNPDALKGLLSAATNGINANGYAASSGIGHTALVKISAVDDNNFAPTLISTTGSISTGANMAYNTLTIVDTVIQIL